jgi:uncharacterized membrane protein
MHEQWLFLAVAVLLIGLGFPLAKRRIGPNRWYGFRVRATFADEQVWYDVNAQAGRDLMVLGALVGILVLLLPQIAWLPPVTTVLIYSGVLAVGSVWSMVRGWRAANRQ